MSNFDKWHAIGFAIIAASSVALVGLLLHYKVDILVAAPGVGLIVGAVAMAFSKQLTWKSDDPK